MLYLLLIILLVVLLVGLPPVRVHPYGWGPSGAVSVLLIVLLVLLLLRVV